MIFLMPIYFVIAIVVIYKLMKSYQGNHKWRQFFILAFLFYLPVGWDVILGRTYFHYLCAKDGGIHIYDTVKLGPEYWDKDGRPRFYTEDKGWFESSVFEGRYVFKSSDTKYKNKLLFNTTKYLHQIVDTKTGNILGEWVKYGMTGGWVTNTGTPFGVSGVQCHSYDATPDNPLITGNALTNATGKINTHYSKFTSYIFLNKETDKDDEL
jgi:hypothetical protein